LPNVGPYIYDVSISGFTRSSIYIYIYDISSLRVKGTSEDNIKTYIKQGTLMKTGLTGLEQEPRNRVMTLRGPKIAPEFLH